MYRHLAALLLVFVVSFAIVQPAAAHANIEHSEPPAGALLQNAPKEIVIAFTEEVDEEFSRIQLLNSKNQVVNAGPGVIDGTDPRVMRLALDVLPNDSYTALWRARSAVDGHITEGSVPFGVGVEATTTSLLPPPGAPDPATAPPSALESVIRWLNYLLAAVTLGGLTFALFVWRPVVQQTSKGPGASAEADATFTHIIRRFIVIGGALFLVSTFLYLLAQAAAAAEVSLLGAVGQPFVRILSSHTGRVIIARVCLIVILIALAWRVSPVGRGSAGRWWAMLVAGAGVALTFSLNSHGAAMEQGAPLAIAADWLHMAAMVVWLGGLLPLLAALGIARRLPDESPRLGMLIPRFSTIAMVCVVLLTLTGLYSWYLHIGSLDLLLATTYGWALLVKVVLFTFLVLIGAINFFLFLPRIQASTKKVKESFRRTVRSEAVIGTLLLVAVGAMMSVAPSTSAWEQHEQQGVVERVTDGDVTLTLRVAPARIGANEWAVDVTDERPGAQQIPATVLFRYAMQGMEMGTLQTEAQQTSSQRYLARGSYTSMGGRWNVEVILRRAGFDDVHHTFVLDIVRSAL